MTTPILLNLILFLFFLTVITTTSSTTTLTTTAAPIIYNILSHGAKPDGKTDSSAALQHAWISACNSPSPAVIVIPAGRYLVRRPVMFDGGHGCNAKKIAFRIQGTLVAPSDFRVLGNAGNWLGFQYVDGVTISGGTLDGQGKGLWDCKMNGHGNCPKGFTALSFSNSKNIVIKGLKSLNSQMFHMTFNGCKDITLHSIKITAPGNSPNTDGIHVQNSESVTILNSKIATGDDCISIGAGTSNLHISNVLCGPGHGISIGSLGKDKDEPGVQNVTVVSCTFVGTQNGVRIKSWGRPSTGFVDKVVFQHLTMLKVENPIIIDQNYCPDHNCPRRASGVKITDVTYRDVIGTSATEVAVDLDCSEKYPCKKIRLEDVKLTYVTDKVQPAQASCKNADGMIGELVQPKITCS